MAEKMERRLTGVAFGVHMRDTLGELKGGFRSYPAFYEGGHVLVGLGLAEYANEPREGASYWLKLSEAGRRALDEASHDR